MDFALTKCGTDMVTMTATVLMLLKIVVYC